MNELINMNNRINVGGGKAAKIRTVTVNDRGQVVIPEDIRSDLGIKGATTLVMIEKEGEIVIMKESEVLAALEELDEGAFWKGVAKASLAKAWSGEDDVWDKLAREDLNE